MVKKGFSLAEALVVMAIVAILFACASKVITTRPQPKKQVTAHGYYECFLNGSTLSQHYVKEGLESFVTTGSCTFEPPPGVAFFNINSYGAVYHSSFQPNINTPLTISISGGNISLTSESDSISLQSNDEELNLRNFFRMMYPNSKIYNGGTMRTGLMISW